MCIREATVIDASCIEVICIIENVVELRTAVSHSGESRMVIPIMCGVGCRWFPVEVPLCVVIIPEICESQL